MIRVYGTRRWNKARGVFDWEMYQARVARLVPLPPEDGRGWELVPDDSLWAAQHAGYAGA